MNRYPLIQRAPGLLPWYDSLAGFQREVHRLFQDLAETGYGPGLDLYEEEEAFVLQCELPGMGREQIAVSFQEGVLSVSGERKPLRESGGLLRAERRLGKFERHVLIPGAVDPARIQATYVDGILRVLLPKAESAKPRQIPVSTAETEKA